MQLGAQRRCWATKPLGRSGGTSNNSLGANGLRPVPVRVSPVAAAAAAPRLAAGRRSTPQVAAASLSETRAAAAPPTRASSGNTPRRRWWAPWQRRDSRSKNNVVCSSSVAEPGQTGRDDVGRDGAGSGSGGDSGRSPAGFSGVFLSVPDVSCAKGGGKDYGSGGSLGMVLEKSKVEFVMPTPVSQGPKLDDSGSGGDIGKIIFNGGGGDGGDGDDDDFFGDDFEGDGDGEGGGDGFFRTALPELYDKLSIGAVFAEWHRTIAELPLILRRAVEMGLFSSAQLVRFFSMDVRPSATRAASRALPPTWAREFVGRMMADPAFLQKMAFEQILAAASTLYHEYKIRGKRFKKELDLVMINVVGMAAATGAAVWAIAPTRSYGSVHKFPWQQMLSGLPNCVFDASGPLRNYTRQARIGSFFARMAELSAIGAVAGGVTSLGQSLAIEVHKYRDSSYTPSVPAPQLAQSAAGLGTFFAINANARYQLIGGMDRYLFGHSNYLWTYLGMSGAARVFGNRIGELSRPWWQGLPNAGAAPTRRSNANRPRRVRKKGAAVSQQPGPSSAAAAGPPPPPQPATVGSATSAAPSDAVQPTAAGGDASSPSPAPAAALVGSTV